MLQTVDLASGAGLDATARAQALAEGIAERQAEISRLAESALAAPIVRAAVEGGWRTWREVPVAAAVEGVLVEGFVDLLLEQPDGDLVVVDWKTDRVPAPADLDAALARYSVQGAAYTLALEAVLSRRVARCLFVFARAPGGALEREVVALRDRIDGVRGGPRRRARGRRLLTRQLVLGELFDELDERGAAVEAGRDVDVVLTALAPPEDAALDRAEATPVVVVIAAARDLRPLPHPADVPGAAVEAPADLLVRHAPLAEREDAPFDRS